MQSSNQQQESNFLHPRYWSTWLGMGLLWLIVQLPWKVQMWLGIALGQTMFILLHRRRFICCVNIKLAFPELTRSERRTRVKQHFHSLGKGLFETALSWWGSEKQLKKLIHIEGEEYFQQALQQKKGFILLSAHFTSLELGGRILAMQTPLHVVYRPHQNPLIESLVAKARTKRYGKAISRDNIRGMIRSLREGHPVWYAQDQNFLRKQGEFIRFFGIETATNTGTSKIAKLSNSQVIPFFTMRKSSSGYLLRFQPALENFPSDNTVDDALKINQLIEQQVREFPDQYLWTHRRFKSMPEGGDRYKKYRQTMTRPPC